MKAILEFDLDNSEDASSFDIILEARKYQTVLWDIDQWLRGEIKYKNDLSEDVRDAYQGVRDKIYEMIAESDITSWP